MGRTVMDRPVQWRRSSARRSAKTPLQSFGRWTVKLRLLWIILVAFLLLSGCVRYDVGVTFTDANHGTIEQQIRLSNQLTGVSRAAANLWLDKLSEQAEELGGQAKHPTDRELRITIPFYNAKDLTTKFDRFFQVLTETGFQDDRAHSASPASVNSQFQIQTNNLIVWQRHRLTYDLDLQSLSIVPNSTDTATLLVNPQDLLTLEFTLNTPWGAESLAASPVASTVRRQGKQLIWPLQSGAVNHLEAVFWVPSPIGIGLVVIVVLVVAGMFLKAWQNPSSLIDLPRESA